MQVRPYFSFGLSEITFLPSYGLLSGVSWFKTDVSVLPIGPIFESGTVQKEASSSTV